jgi:hypothetical protein
MSANVGRREIRPSREQALNHRCGRCFGRWCLNLNSGGRVTTRLRFKDSPLTRVSSPRPSACHTLWNADWEQSKTASQVTLLVTTTDLCVSGRPRILRHLVVSLMAGVHPVTVTVRGCRWVVVRTLHSATLCSSVSRPSPIDQLTVSSQISGRRLGEPSGPLAIQGATSPTPRTPFVGLGHTS